MKIWLRLVYADGDVAATLLRPTRWSYAFVALLYPFYTELNFQTATRYVLIYLNIYDTYMATIYTQYGKVN